MSGNSYSGGDGGETAYWLVSKARYAELRTPEYAAEQDRLYDMAQAVGERETAQRLPELKRLTWYHNDFGTFVPNVWVTPQLLSERYAELTAEFERKQPPPRSDGFTSVLGAIDDGKKAPKQSRKAKAQGKTKSDREER